MIDVKPNGPGEFAIFKDGQFRGYIFREGGRWGTQGYRDGRCIEAKFSQRATAVKAVAN